MGKKKKKLMASFKLKFVEGAMKNKIHKKQAVEIFELLEKFAEYGFNKSHATAYAMITFQTAWLKAHYPSEFLAANMSSEFGDSDRLSILVHDAKDHGINIVDPSINLSRPFFYANSNGDIYYALSAIKNVGYKSAAMIYENKKENGDYKTLFDLCSIDSRVINKKILENLKT